MALIFFLKVRVNGFAQHPHLDLSDCLLVVIFYYYYLQEYWIGTALTVPRAQIRAHNDVDYSPKVMSAHFFSVKVPFL